MTKPSLMRILTSDGPQDVSVADSEDASMIGRFWNATRHFLNTGDEDAMLPFAGKTVGGRKLETDPDAIEFWARRGELEFEEIYATHWWWGS